MPNIPNPSGTGSYYYATMQKPNSSYPSVGMRNVAAAPGGSDGMLKVFASGSKLYVVFPDGSVYRLLSGSI